MSQPRRRQPEATRAQIMGAAMQTLQESGAAGFTLDAVVARLPLSKGALLHHFPSKAELLKALRAASTTRGRRVLPVASRAESGDRP